MSTATQSTDTPKARDSKPAKDGSAIVNIKMDRETREQMNYVCGMNDIPAAEFLRRAVAAYLKSENPDGERFED